MLLNADVYCALILAPALLVAQGVHGIDSRRLPRSSALPDLWPGCLWVKLSPFSFRATESAPLQKGGLNQPDRGSFNGPTKPPTRTRGPLSAAICLAALTRIAIPKPTIKGMTGVKAFERNVIETRNPTIASR